MEKITELIEKFRSGSITDEEIKLLMGFLNETNPSEQIKRILNKAWDVSAGCNSEVDSRALYEGLKERLGLVSQVKGSAEERPNKGVRETIIGILRYAAVFLVAFGLSWLIRSLMYENNKSVLISHIQRVTVPLGSKSKIVLPDGSEVILNSGSTLAYDIKEFGKRERKVFMEGEGYFTVARNPSRPFYVNTPAMVIKVKGTTFNIKAYPEERTEEAILISGSVEVFPRYTSSKKQIVELTMPNQKIVFTKSEANSKLSETQQHMFEEKIIQAKLLGVQTVEKVQNSVAWKDDMLIFDNEPFSALVTRIERWYNVNIQVNNPELEKARFTGKFDKETLDQVLKALTTLVPFDYTIKQNTVIISRFNSKTKMPMKQLH
ncbi:MAG: FecR family protein [Candidatus Atribacteria bacterium]|nr:FecR family protein [Candidatus Atribacteria bacterium]